MTEGDFILCEKCAAPLEPGVAHDAELCATLARFKAAARQHRNFGKPLPVWKKAESRKLKAETKRPSCGRVTAAEFAERQLPPSDRLGAKVEIGNQKAEMPAADLPHRERQAAFVAAGSAESDNERMLELLWTGFIPEDATRSSRGQWVSTAELIHRHKINTPHSRASQLRGSETLTPHPLVTRFRLDIDQSMNPEVTGCEGSAYSVCFVENSERLRRERDKEKTERLKI